jgi:prepilin-type N-terminal cleavage/methylation domain-containing protein
MSRSITHKQHHGARGFTMIELLVVIAIIVLLAAILFPVFLSVYYQEAAPGEHCSLLWSRWTLPA